MSGLSRYALTTIMGIPAKIDENALACEQVRQMRHDYRAGHLSEADRNAVDCHCAECAECRDLLGDCLPPAAGETPTAPFEPPPYLADQIKSEARQRRPAQRAVIRKRMIGSPQFLAACAVIVAGTIATLVAVYYLNSLRPRQDAWAPAFVVSSGGGVIMLADTEDPMRELSPEEMLERLHQGRAASVWQGPDGTGDSQQPATAAPEAADGHSSPPTPPEP